jgi:hypothetical protein
MAAAVAGAGTALSVGAGPSAATVAGLVVAAAIAPAFMATVVIHELTHALTATLLGATVIRIVVGEGRVLFRIGRQPQMVVGRVFLGNGVTSVLDLRRSGYRSRTCIMLLVAPAVSLMIALAAWQGSTGWGLAARSAALAFAACNLTIAIVTLLPTPTFGGRVWSDLASARFLMRASEAEIVEQMVLSARDCLAAHVENGDIDGAIATARATIDVAPESPLAHSLLAFALHSGGRYAEAGAVARAALLRPTEAADRDYLLRFMETAEPPATSGEVQDRPPAADPRQP